MAKNVFERIEIKYLITKEQKQYIQQAMKEYMQLDEYGRTTIRNLYFDTESYLLIRRSIEKTVYKEKLRLRTYERAGKDTPSFVELKKKYKSVVYKRRVCLPYAEAYSWLTERTKEKEKSQITKEVDYFLDLYKTLEPRVFLSYEREAYFDKSGSDFRVTFDENILARTSNLSLSSSCYGTSLLEEGMTLMEIKCSGGIPLWMTKVLSDLKIYKTSFSKYGTAYRKMIFPIQYERNIQKEKGIINYGMAI